MFYILFYILYGIKKKVKHQIARKNLTVTLLMIEKKIEYQRFLIDDLMLNEKWIKYLPK